MVKNLSCVSCAAWNVFPINSLLCPRPGQARIDYLAPLFDDNTIILKNDDRRFIVLLSEYVPCTYFHKNNKSQLDIPFVLEFRNPISLTALFALTAKKPWKIQRLAYRDGSLSGLLNWWSLPIWIAWIVILFPFPPFRTRTNCTTCLFIICSMHLCCNLHVLQLYDKDYFYCKEKKKKSSINQFYIIRYVHRCAFVQEPLEVQKHVIVFS